MEIVQISIKEILHDFFFSFKSDSDLIRLKESIQFSGIRTPVHVLPTKEGYRLLSGFSRYKAALELELDVIPATIVQDEMAVENAFREVLLEQRTIHDFNLVEKAKVLRILDGLDVPWEDMKTHFLPQLDLPANSDLISEVKRVLTFLPIVLDYIEKYDLSLKQAMLFKSLSHRQQELFVGLAMDLEIRSVELSGIMTMFSDIAAREDNSIEQVFHLLDCPSILNEKKLTRDQKLTRMKTILQNRRYPRLTSWNENLEILRKGIKLPQSIRISWNRSLETPGISMQIDVRSVEDIDGIMAVLSSQANWERIGRMLEIV